MDSKSYFQTYLELKATFESVSQRVSAQAQYEASLLEPELKEAYKKLKLAIIAELRSTNEFYQKIHAQNMQLMSNQSFEMKVTKIKSAEGTFEKFSTHFEGGIMPNGYLYFRSVETNQDFTFQSYASFLEGSIDEHGAGAIAFTDTEAAILNTLPALYETKIGLDGDLFLKVIELDPTFDRKLIAFELAGDPFNRNEKKRKLFLRNRSEMNRLIAERIHELAKETPAGTKLDNNEKPL